MECKNVLLLLLISSAATSFVSAADYEKEYDYFLLVRQWGVSFCEAFHCKHTPVERFTIHGLWPERFDGHWPDCCDSHYPFRFEKLVPVIKDLLDCWFSYTGGISQQCSWSNFLVAVDSANSANQSSAKRLLVDDTNVTVQSNGGGSPDYQFWKHEWEKHGTCALDVFDSELDYFQTVLDLHHKYDIDAAFEKAGIVPSERDYKTKRLIEAVEDDFGYKPWFVCHNGEVSEIRTCINKKLKIIDCPVPDDSNYGCPDRATLPPRSPKE